MGISLKKIIIILVTIALSGIVIFFFAFLALFAIPIVLILFALRKVLFKKIFSYGYNSFNEEEKFFHNNKNYIEADYKKEKEEDA